MKSLTAAGFDQLLADEPVQRISDRSHAHADVLSDAFCFQAMTGQKSAIS